MNRQLELFINKYVKALNEENAAIFAGAGISVPAGYVNWKLLLKDVAEELKLEIDKENDLIALAQYYANEKGGRGAINQKLIEEFTKEATLTENLQLLAELPIKFYWTTNYDKLIEKALENAHKLADAKITPQNLALSLPRRDAIVYKMHGDITLPHEAVLTKDDFESYNSKRQLFTTALQGDLVSKTFLFIGFSFDDPNLEYILSRIRILLEENQRDHYCFFKRPQISNYLKNGVQKEEAEELSKYDNLRLEYKIKDLKRYSINALLVDDYNEITEVLQAINKKIKRQNIFISGAAHEYGSWGEGNAKEFAYNLSNELAAKKYRIITGFGLGIASSVINGALTYLYSSKYRHIEEVLVMRPFPQITQSQTDLKSMWSNYRESMMEQAGIALFLFGNKLVGDEVLPSDGMIEEFELAIKSGVIPIPIGATGYTAKVLWERVNLELGRFELASSELEEAFRNLNDPTKSSKELINDVVKIANMLR